MTPARVRMHRLAALAGLSPPDKSESQWYVSLGDAPAEPSVTGDPERTADANADADTNADADVRDQADADLDIGLHVDAGVTTAVHTGSTAVNRADADVPHVTVMLEDAGEVLMLSATLGTAIRPHPARFWCHLLGLNASLLAADRGAITIDRPGHTIYLTQAIAESVSGADQIQQQFETFVAQARRLIAVLNTSLLLDGPEATDALDDTDDMQPPSTPATFV